MRISRRFKQTVLVAAITVGASTGVALAASASAATPSFSAVPQTNHFAVPSTVNVLVGEHLLVKGELITVHSVNKFGPTESVTYGPNTPAGVNGHPQRFLLAG